MSGRVGHLAQRFFSSLRAAPLDAGDRAWVEVVLTPAELQVWRTLGRADAAESVAVARRAASELGPDADPVLLAAALLHDVGKTECGLNTVGRAFATVWAGIVSHGRARRSTGRIGRYVNHDELGARRLAAAGARPQTVGWARAHHRPRLWDSSGLAPSECRVLAAADGE